MIKSRTMRWIWNPVRMKELRNAYKISVGKPERKRHHRIKQRCEDVRKISRK
jgi:hypothetical protein